MFIAAVCVSGEGRFFTETFPMVVDEGAHFVVGTFLTYGDAFIAAEEAVFDEVVSAAFAGRRVSAVANVLGGVS